MKIRLGMDRNGNKVIKIPGNEKGRGFSIQTNGRMPTIHRLALGSHYLTPKEEDELAQTVEHGTQKQMDVFEASKG